VKRYLRDLKKVEIFPNDTVAFLVFDSEVPVGSRFVTAELDVESCSVFESILAKDVLTPFIGAMRGDVQLVDRHAGFVVQREILIARERHGGGEQGQDREDEKRSHGPYVKVWGED
jgi:hypothetical protein